MDEVRDSKNGKPPCLVKVDITAHDYHRIFHNYNFDEPRHVTYFYFDTDKKRENAELYKKKIRFRVRLKSEKYLLELKQKLGEKKKEIRQGITVQEYESLSKGVFPEGEIKNYLLEQQCLFRLHWIATVNTFRSKKQISEGILLVLDQSTYLSSEVRYQVELRSEKSTDSANSANLQSIANQLGLPQQELSLHPKVDRIYE